MIEVATLIGDKGIPLIYILGSPARVEFPFEFAWELHQRFPGIIRHMVHTHPDGITDLSEEDRTTLKAWTFAFAPDPITLDVVCRTPNGISHKRYSYVVETKESWEGRGKESPRKSILELTDLTLEAPIWIHNLLTLSDIE